MDIFKDIFKELKYLCYSRICYQDILPGYLTRISNYDILPGYLTRISYQDILLGYWNSVAILYF